MACTAVPFEGVDTSRAAAALPVAEAPEGWDSADVRSQLRSFISNEILLVGR